MKIIVQNTYNFEELRSIDAVYIDKTAILHGLIVDRARKFFFISRPRRFGKSLMISTLKAIFQGRKDLFKGLAIEKTNYDWSVHPILHFDFSVVSTTSIDEFQKDFATRVANTLSEVGYVYDASLTVGANFEKAIRMAQTRAGKGVVVLIDEYDAPVSHALADPAKAEAIREVLANFYIQIKAAEGDIRFLMMTGVTKFTQLSVFSALNNLSDLTLSAETASLLGYTDDELDGCFAEHLQTHAKVMGLAHDDYRAQLRHWYDGYRFSPRADVKVYNPVAIAKTLGEMSPYFEPTWAKTARPSSLMKFLSRSELAELNYEQVENVTEPMLDVCALDRLPVIAMLYQSGYLTIKDYRPTRREYTLTVPNEEVRQDLAALVVYSQKGEKDGQTLMASLKNSLLDAKFDTAERILKSFYAGLTYGAYESRTAEASYQRVLYTLLVAGGFDVRPEDSQAVGRADIVARHADGIFIFEIKVDQSAADALKQIHEKKYAEPYLVDERSLYAVGLNFDSASRHLADFAIEKISKTGSISEVVGHGKKSVV